MAFPYTSGDVLTAADLNASSGLVLVKTQTVGSSVTSVTLTDAFSSTFENYRIVMALPSFTTTGAGLNFQFGTTATGYYGSMRRDLYSGGLSDFVRTNNGSSLTIGQVDTSWGGVTVSMDVFRPNSNTVNSINGMSFGRGYACWFAGARDSAVFTGFTISVGDGTFTGGTIRVYGYNNG